MNSLRIEISRSGSANDYVLNPDTPYISLCENYPQQTFRIACGQTQFFEIIKGLRYTDADPRSSPDALDFFRKLTAQLFEDIKFSEVTKNESGPLHIRLVTTPLELALLPFEFVQLPGTNAAEEAFPLLTNPQRIVTLTRETRQDSDSRYVWPSEPRVLFAWAQPADSVPHQQHFDTLAELVKPLCKPKKDIPDPVADIEALLTELPNVSIQSLQKEITKAISENKPYTHVNILAHGGHKSLDAGFQYGLILCKEDDPGQFEKADGKALVKALVSANKTNIPTVITLSSCDSGNTGNSITPAGSLIYQLHNAGIPFVYASQFPLTKEGSVVMIKTLYNDLINACDPRIALYKTRLDLKLNQNHDWASLIAYARFTPDLNEQLEAAKLKMLFSSMKIAGAWVDHVFKYNEKIPSDVKEIAYHELSVRLNATIDNLSSYLKDNKKVSTLLTESLRAEHLGLLGSAYKRKAEYLYRLIEFNKDLETELLKQSFESLILARDFYYLGFDANLTSHWNAMQYLSLKAITDGNWSEADKEIWTLIKFMAQKDEKNAVKEIDKIWAWGTLAELYLLQPLYSSEGYFDEEANNAKAIATDYINRIATADSKYNDAKESTARQFERYIIWWPIINQTDIVQKLKLIADELFKKLLELGKHS